MADKPMLIVDSHLDLAFNAIQINRDITQPAAVVRTHDHQSSLYRWGSSTVTFPELRKGRVGIVFGTVMSRIDPTDWLGRTGGMYSQAQCYGVGHGHYSFYKAMERDGILKFIHKPCCTARPISTQCFPTSICIIIIKKKIIFF